MNNLLVAQSGGPTSAINATLAGILDRAMNEGSIDTVYGARYGIQGVLRESFVNLSARAGLLEELPELATTPAAALGSCRYKLQDPAKDTVWRLSQYVREKGITDITVVGAPKTIDNDLFGIDHCPGFGSAAKYIATTMAELERELVVYDTPYVIITEMMGRNAGWLTAAAALSQGVNSQVPYLIYLEEHPFDLSDFLSDIRGELSAGINVMVAISEGIRDRSGRMICDYGDRDKAKDAFGHTIATGAGHVLENAVRQNLGCKVRSIELNLLQRCAGHILSKTDIDESMELGRNAVKLCLEGQNGMMSSLRRLPLDEYRVVYEAQDIAGIADREKKVPAQWITSEGNNVTPEMLNYLRPLVQGEVHSRFERGVPKYVVLI